MKNKMSLKDAIVALRSGKKVEENQVDLTSGEVSNVDALFLHHHKINVEESQIYFDDDAIAYDPEFDDNEWGEPQAATSNIKIEISVPSHVKDWLEGKKVNIEKLISNLLISQMTSDQIINQN